MRNVPPEFWQQRESRRAREGESMAAGDMGGPCSLEWQIYLHAIIPPALACILILQPLSCAIVLSHHRGFSPKFTLWERPKLPKEGPGRGTAAAGIASGDSTSGIGMDHRRGKFTGFVPRISLWWHVRGLCARWSWNLSQYLLLLQNECVPHDCPRVRLVF